MLELNIQTFAGDGEAAAGGGQAAAFDVDAELQKRFPGVKGFAAPKKQAEAKDEETGPDAGPEPKDDAGQDAAAENAKEEQKTPEQEDAELAELLKGPMKAAAQRYFQNQLNDRFKNHNQKLAAAEQRAAELTEAMLPYLQKLGVDPNDLEAVKAAVMEDKSNFRAKAVEQGITIEEAIKNYQDERKTERDAEELQRRQAQIAQRQQEAADMQILEGWQKEAEEIKKDDPEFDLMQELETNEEFRNMVNAHVSVKNAYRATHYEQNMAKVAGAVEKQTAMNTAQRIASRQSRPVEGGLTSNNAVSSKTSYKDLSDKEFMKLFKSMGY